MHNPETIIPVLERQLTNLRSEYQEFMSAISHDLSATFRQTKGFSQISWIESSDAAIKVQKLPKITGDKEQIKIVFFHLLKNALLYRSDSVRPEIIVSCEEQKEHWEFTVSDNGIGVPGNMDERIFQVLKRAVADNDYPGHGMGLATAKKVITRHGGTIALRRDDTALTLMVFTLPKHPIDI